MNVKMFQTEKPYITKFLQFPKQLYRPSERTQKPEEELQLLKGTHVLSRYFSCTGCLVLEKGVPLARCMVFLYPNDERAYIGFFECIESTDVSDLMFDHVRSFCQEHQKLAVCGPVNGSFWLQYRLKTNRFGHPYTSEPYNKEYYLQLFLHGGYQITDTYISNHFHVVPSSHENPKHKKRLESALEKGYSIKSLCPEDFDQILKEVYYMITELYQNFPIYKPIDMPEFISLFSPMNLILDYSMVKIAYFDNQPAAFFIALPNYLNLISGTMTLPKLWKLLRIKKKPREYVMLYMGASGDHPGLGSAVAQSIKKELQGKQVPSIGALIHKGKVSGNYFKELIDDQFEYVLLEQSILSETGQGPL